MLAIKYPEWFEPFRSHQEKDILPIQQRKGIWAEMMLFQNLVEKRRMGDPAVRHQKKWRLLRCRIEEKALFQYRIKGHGNQDRCLTIRHKCPNRTEDFVADTLQFSILLVCRPQAVG